MTHDKNDTQDRDESQATFEAMVREKLQQAVRTALMGVLEAEGDAFIGAARYEHAEQRRDYRNGHYTRGLDTSLGHISDLPVPRARQGHQTQLFERYHRRRTDLDPADRGDVQRWSEHGTRRRGGRDVDWHAAKCLDGL